MIKNCLTCIFCFVLVSLISAQKMDFQKLDLYFDALEQNNKFMGSLAVSQDGKIIYKRSIGFSDVENKLKPDENSKYRIGSISKTFTAVLVMKAVEEKKLTLDQTIGKFFPTLQNSDKITIEQLLRHRSGIHNFTDDDDYMSWYTQAKTEQEMTAVIVNGGNDFEPGTKAEYSNSNYVLLTYVLEKTFKQSYATLLKKYIADPLNLKNTSLGGKINPANNECKSYEFTDAWEAAAETDISIPLGAGGIVSTPSDLVKFSDALFEGKILKKKSLELMKTMQDDFGLGLFQIPFYDKTAYGHRGGIDEFTSVFSCFPTDKISFALTTNGSNYNGNEIPLTVLSAVYNRPFEIPDFSTYAIDPEELDKYLGVYASAQLPFKITITKDGNNLIIQPTEQAAMPLEASKKDQFKIIKVGIVLEFNPLENKMVLKQGEGTFVFVRE